MAIAEKFSDTAYFGRKVGLIEALAIMHNCLDPEYRGNAPEYVPGKEDFGLPRVGIEGIARIYFCPAPPSLRYSNLSAEAKARMDKAIRNGSGK